MNNVRFGIVGIGNMGSAHAMNIYNKKVEGAKLVAVCDNNFKRLDWAKDNLGNVETFENYNEFLDNEKIDAVLIATPHYLHPVIAKIAFERGIHVLTEKPAGVYTEQVEAMNDAARKSGKKFGIMYNQRTNPIFAKAREMVQNGEIGELKRVVWIITNWYRRQSYYDSGTWRATWRGEGGGVLINQCPHNIDVMQWIVGMPKTVTSHCYYGKYHNIEVEDDVTAFFEFDNGATGVFITTTGENPGTNRLEISGTKAKLVIENGKMCVWSSDISERDYCFMAEEDYKNVKHGFSEFSPDGKGGGHVGILQNFTNSILHDEELLAPGHEGINGLTISNAIHLSDWTDEKITLPIDKIKFKELLMKKVQNSQIKEGATEDLSINFGVTSSRWDVQW